MTHPEHWTTDAVLSDGGTVRIRPIEPSDADLLRALHGRLSPETVYRRFFTMVRVLPDRELERLTTVDHVDRVALVAQLREDIVGVVRYDRSPGTTHAEVAIVVEDAQQGRGLGPLLLEHLAAAGQERGVASFTADVLPSNRHMVEVFRSAGYEVERRLADGYLHLAYPIDPTDASVAVARAREHRAESRSVARLLSPRSVAVVGASREPGTAGHEVLRALLSGFTGTVHAVNPAATEVLGLPARADVRDVPDDLDLVVVAVPAAQVLDVVAACADKRVAGLVVLAGGFADGGAPGQALLDALVRAVRDGGMRLVGPGAMGVVNTDPAVSLHATFALERATPGRVGVLSQSGGLAGTVLQSASQRGLGLSTFVSLGDRADVSGNDLLQYWLDDARTEVVALHLQGFGNPRKFARIARELGRAKPVVALKSGRGERDVAVDALFRSAGVIRVDTLSQLFETAQLLALQPVPAGPRVGLVATSSALAALAVDACRAAGLVVARPSGELQERLHAVPGVTGSDGPVDLGPLAPPSSLGDVVRLVAGSGEVDAVLALVTPLPDLDDVARALAEGAAGAAVPVLTCFLGQDGVPAPLAVAVGAEARGRGSVPSYASPEAAALALGRAVAYGAWLARPQGTVPVGRLDVPELDGVPHDGSWVSPEVVERLGLPVWPTRRVRTSAAAREAAAGLGWPVALKAADERWRGRLDVGAVRLSVGPDDLDEAWAALVRFGPEVLVQPMAPPGVSTVVRLVQDASVGPLLSLRLGGPVADALADPVVVALPLTDVDAAEVVASVRGRALLDGQDVGALQDLLHQVAHLGEALPAVAEVVLDPVLVGRQGVTVLHAGVRLLPAPPDPEQLPRRLSGASAAHLR